MNSATRDGVPAEVLAQWAQLRELPQQETRGYGFVIAAVILGGVAVAVVVARTWLRAVVQRKADASDWLMLFALLPTAIFLIGAILAVQVWHYDQHIWNLDPLQTVQMLKVFLFLKQFYVLDSALIKISILLFYDRFEHHASKKLFRIAIRITIGTVMANWLAFAIALFWTCRPFPAYWYRLDSTYRATHSFTCNDEGANVIAVSIIAVVHDIIITLMPISLCWNLHLNRRKKCATYILGCLGLVASVASGIRIYWAYVAFFVDYDFSWTCYQIILWTLIELSLGIICASAPALKVVFARFFEGGHNIIWQSGETENADALLRTTSTAKSVRSREDSAWSVTTSDRLSTTMLRDPSHGKRDDAVHEVEMDSRSGQGRWTGIRRVQFK